MPPIKPEQTLTLIQREDIEKLKKIWAFYNIKKRNEIITKLCDIEIQRNNL